jgi:hypothetical protein
MKKLIEIIFSGRSLKIVEIVKEIIIRNERVIAVLLSNQPLK